MQQSEIRSENDTQLLKQYAKKGGGIWTRIEIAKRFFLSVHFFMQALPHLYAQCSYTGTDLIKTNNGQMFLSIFHCEAIQEGLPCSFYTYHMQMCKIVQQQKTWRTLLSDFYHQFGGSTVISFSFYGWWSDHNLFRKLFLEELYSLCAVRGYYVLCIEWLALKWRRKEALKKY